MFHRPVVAHRLFFALRPPAALARQLVGAAPWFAGSGQPLLAEHLHVTLDILDDRTAVEDWLRTALLDLGDSIRMPPFDLVLDMATGGRRSIALRPRRQCQALEALRREIGNARGAAGIAERKDYRFSPHLTLGYRDGGAFSQPIEPVAWPVTDFVLIHSHLGRPRHDVLGRWRLEAATDPQLVLF